jgi:hypothetical protein
MSGGRVHLGSPLKSITRAARAINVIMPRSYISIGERRLRVVEETRPLRLLRV